jgi:potassium uptake TrkH family protein
MVTFAALIIAGMLLLKLPRATVGDGISWLDALFTSTSAVCVTGLVVVDTETAFSATGHWILLVLIQLGGLGVMTLTTFLAQLFGGVSLRSRVLVQDLISEENLGRIGRTLPLVLGMVILFEVAGAVALHACIGDVPAERGGTLFSAVFHSISAFCNAGFSNWSGGLYDPLVRGNTAVQSIVMVLIVAGGMGFPVVYATTAWLWRRVVRIFARRSRRPVLSLHARLAWMTTAALVVIGAAGIGLAEYVFADNPHDTPPVVASLFHSVTARTAGFNISPVEAMTPAAVSMIVLLMFVGGCPGSTAGGAKTTAFAIALLNVRRILLGRRDVEVFGRRVPEEVVSRALAVMFLSMAWIGVAGTVLALLHPDLPLSDLVFETVSALSTVGLSRGVTAQLGPGAKVLIILTMFAGRIGVLYFIFAFAGRREPAPYRVPEEAILVT